MNSVESWFNEHKPDVVILCAAKVGGIHANNSNPKSRLYPGEFKNSNKCY